jgi:hypothetical protein
VKPTETIESVAGIGGIVAVLYLQVIDGLAGETVALAIAAIAGLGGYRVLKEWLDSGGSE